MAQSMERVRAIIVKGDTIALVERIRNGKRYLVFPGGGVEAGESFREAVVREVREETGLLIDVHGLVATVTFSDHLQGFVGASVVGGTFGTGDGPEYTDPSWAGRGSYRPVWCPMSSVAIEPVYPQGVASLVLEAYTVGWPATPVGLFDDLDS